MANEYKTVADLIVELQKMPQNAPILIRDNAHECNYEIWKVYAPGEDNDDPYAVVLYDGN